MLWLSWVCKLINKRNQESFCCVCVCVRMKITLPSSNHQLASHKKTFCLKLSTLKRLMNLRLDSDPGRGRKLFVIMFHAFSRKQEKKIVGRFQCVRKWLIWHYGAASGRTRSELKPMFIIAHFSVILVTETCFSTQAHATSKSSVKRASIESFTMTTQLKVFFPSSSQLCS